MRNRPQRQFSCLLERKFHHASEQRISDNYCRRKPNSCRYHDRSRHCESESTRSLFEHFLRFVLRSLQFRTGFVFETKINLRELDEKTKGTSISEFWSKSFKYLRNFLRRSEVSSSIRRVSFDLFFYFWYFKESLAYFHSDSFSQFWRSSILSDGRLSDCKSKSFFWTNCLLSFVSGHMSAS
jgi:hypothetical protein